MCWEKVDVDRPSVEANPWVRRLDLRMARVNQEKNPYAIPSLEPKVKIRRLGLHVLRQTGSLKDLGLLQRKKGDDESGWNPPTHGNQTEWASVTGKTGAQHDGTF